MGSLNRHDQETIINFNKEDLNASVFTYERSWQKHLEGLGFHPIMENGFGAKEYMVPKSMIRKPLKKRKATAAQRDAAIRSLAKIAAERAKNKAQNRK